MELVIVDAALVESTFREAPGSGVLFEGAQRAAETRGSKR